MSNVSIFLIGTGISLLCVTGLILSMLEMKRLGRGGGERALSMAVRSARPQRVVQDGRTR
jgi:hypothetical protein